MLRLDGDMYESTIVPLTHLFDRVSPGGWVIVDDYQMMAPCRKAVRDFFDDRRIRPQLHDDRSRRRLLPQGVTGRTCADHAHSGRRCDPVSECSTTKATPPQWMSLKRWKCHWGWVSRNSLSASRSPDTPVSRFQRSVVEPDDHPGLQPGTQEVEHRDRARVQVAVDVHDGDVAGSPSVPSGGSVSS